MTWKELNRERLGVFSFADRVLMKPMRPDTGSFVVRYHWVCVLIDLDVRLVRAGTAMCDILAMASKSFSVT